MYEGIVDFLRYSIIKSIHFPVRAQPSRPAWKRGNKITHKTPDIAAPAPACEVAIPIQLK
jgi:hypothetical protein